MCYNNGGAALTIKNKSMIRLEHHQTRVTGKIKQQK